MPNCKNDSTRTYKGTEPSPKGYGYCAHAEKVGAQRQGRDKLGWHVSQDKNGRLYWARNIKKKTNEKKISDKKISEKKTSKKKTSKKKKKKTSKTSKKKTSKTSKKKTSKKKTSKKKTSKKKTSKKKTSKKKTSEKLYYVTGDFDYADEFEYPIRFILTKSIRDGIITHRKYLDDITVPFGTNESLEIDAASVIKLIKRSKSISRKMVSILQKYNMFGLNITTAIYEKMKEHNCPDKAFMRNLGQTNTNMDSTLKIIT